MDYDLVVSFKTGKRSLAPGVGRLLAFFSRLFKPNCSQYATRCDYKSNSYSFYQSENILLLNIPLYTLRVSVPQYGHTTPFVETGRESKAPHFWQGMACPFTSMVKPHDSHTTCFAPGRASISEPQLPQ